MTDNRVFRIGLIGLDTGHVLSTVKLLHETNDPYHVEGASVSCACEEASEDFFNYHRTSSYRSTLTEEYGIPIVATLEEVAERSDAIFLSSIDARQHLRQFKAIAQMGKPVIIEKPLTISVQEAEEMFELADRYRIPLFCCSSLRYADTLVQALRDGEKDRILGMDCSGPLYLEPQLPGLFWYGVHLTELLYAVLGPGCEFVMAIQGAAGREHYIGRWKDGRLGTFYGDTRTIESHIPYTALIHREHSEKLQLINVRSSEKPDFCNLLEQAVKMLRTGIAPIATEEMLEVIRFMEAANKSRKLGVPVRL